MKQLKGVKCMRKSQQTPWPWSQLLWNPKWCTQRKVLLWNTLMCWHYLCDNFVHLSHKWCTVSSYKHIHLIKLFMLVIYMHLIKSFGVCKYAHTCSKLTNHPQMSKFRCKQWLLGELDHAYLTNNWPCVWNQLYTKLCESFVRPISTSVAGVRRS